MPKFCPECGVRLSDQEIKYCPECGCNLKKFIKTEEPERDSNSKKTSINIYQLGEKLEEAVEQIFRAQGFETERRKRIRGKSGAINEIDIYAKKGRRVIAVECKNLSMPVSVSQVRDFSQKLDDLDIAKGYFASNTEFSSGARQFAMHKNITLWTKENLMEKFWIKNALPLNIFYDEVIDLHLKNKDEVEIIESDLYFHPYFAIEYSFKANYHDPTRKLHKFRDEGIVFIDALDGKILNKGGIKEKIISKIFSKEDEKIDSKTLDELSYYKNKTSYAVPGGSYQVKIMEPEVQNRFAKRLAIDFVINKNTQRISYQPKSSDSLLDIKFITFRPKKKNVLIKKMHFLYVPKWSVIFLSKNIDYTREIFAFSGEKIEDSISYCPEHFKSDLLSFLNKSKKTIAVCEICGKAFCEDHIKQCPVCNKWICYKDGISCAVCGTFYCPEHINKTCSICSKEICDECYSICPICNKTYGKKHEVVCDNCGTVVCPECMTSKGLIRKKHYCLNCSK